MKKFGLVVSGLLFSGTTAAVAQITCTPSPSCAELGYTQTESSCSGDYVRCPFDSSKVFCVQCPDQCEELGYTKVATGGYASCPEGQTVSKCKTNSAMYKCDGTACSYNYYLSDNMPASPYTYGCKTRDYGNTNCYAWRDNSSYKDYEEDAARCKAAAVYVELPPDCSYQYNCTNNNDRGPGFYRDRTSSGGNYLDACGGTQYESVQSKGYYVTMNTGSYDRCSNYGYGSSSGPCCDYISPGTPGYSYQQAGWTCSYSGGSYGSGGMSPVCQAESQYPRTYVYNGVSMKFSEYCYKKYKIYTACTGQKYAGSADAIGYGWDYRGY